MQRSPFRSRRNTRASATAVPTPAGTDTVVGDPDLAAGEPLAAGRTHPWRRWVLGTIALIVVLFVAVFGYLWSIPLPSNPGMSEATVVYDANGHVLANFSEQYRVDVQLRQVPQVVIQAVVSTEDRHFFSEGAINPVSIGRAVLNDVSGGRLEGGSTITQQYVKQAYLNSKRTLTRKVEEAVLAIHLNEKESKDEILQNYLNIIYWGRGAYGVEAASRAYFGKDVAQLGLPEASLLAGLIREPESADPARDPALARTNQTDTLDAMVRDQKITRTQALAVEQLPFSKYVIPPPSVVSQTQSRASGDDYFIAAVREELYAKYGTRLVDGGGLRVTSTFDPTLQAEAFDAMYGHNPKALDPAAGDPSGSIVSIDGNGYVRAMVGGQDYSKSTVNLALGASGGGSGRQAGSTFKAFMLAALIREGYSVKSIFSAPPKVVLPNGNAGGTPWTVTNYEGEAVSPTMNLIDATALSVNTVYAQVVAKIGATNLDSMAKAMGIRPAELRGAYPSQVLGTADVSPLEMAAAYATLADGGVYHLPILITKVTKSDGSPLPLPVVAKARTVLTSAQAAVETYVLQQVVARGTGVAAGGLSSPVAGKTGTTENSGDAWFVGYTAKLTTAVWMGYANSEKSMDGFRGLRNVTGGTLPAELWHAYMAAVLASSPQYGGSFPPVPSLAGKTLKPWPLVGDVITPGPTTTTTAPSTTAPTTTAPSTTAPSTTTTTTIPGPSTTNQSSTTTTPSPTTLAQAPTATSTTT